MRPGQVHQSGALFAELTRRQVPRNRDVARREAARGSLVDGERELGEAEALEVEERDAACRGRDMLEK